VGLPRAGQAQGKEAKKGEEEKQARVFQQQLQHFF